MSLSVAFWRISSEIQDKSLPLVNKTLLAGHAFRCSSLQEQRQPVQSKYRWCNGGGMRG
jgi:hypothetical protein